ncbi:hypothetical protein [Methylosinus sp. PW1]|uniref:hypothetical protein n=1 Tax=Methylosinus sp. PW1 TaxID=107636 RepID=UPI000560E665|nr:hypothetical protein [Methylosinus sp. PW1]
MDRKIFTDAEVAEVTDFNDIGSFARDGVDHVVGGAIDYPRHWADFAVSQLNPLQLSISAGSLFAGAIVYRNATAAVISVQSYLPIISSDRKYIAILADGAVETVSGNRLVEVDANTEETVSQSLPIAETRKINFTIVQGAASPTPAKPAIPSDRCCIAFVELSNTAIIAIEIFQDLRAKSLYEVEGRMTQAEGAVSDVQSSVKTIKTDILSIYGQLGNIPSPVAFRQLKTDVALIRVKLKLPDAARAYWYDPALLGDAWDAANASWLARIREGIRFPWAGQRDAQLALLSSDNPSLTITGNLALPVWTEETRIEVLGDGGSVNISELTHTVVTAVQKTLSRTVTEYGPTVTICENQAGWGALANQSVGALFTKDGETFQVVADLGPGAPWPGHEIYEVQQVIQRTVTDTYWDYITNEVGLNGSIYGQTFLNAQASIVTSVDLSFKGVGVNGDVHLLILGCYDDGEPNFDNVIAHVVKNVIDLSVGWVKFSMTPTLLDPGKRYAWATVTTGNHSLETVSGNKFAQGSRFLCTDGVWSQPSVDSDFAFRLNCAKFATTRTVVDFQPLTLDSGMTEIRILHAGWQAAGVPVTWRIKNPALPNAQWQSLTLDNADGASDLMGLPPLVQLQAVFIGTTELQPAIVLDANARGVTYRPRGECVAISQSHDFGLSTTSIQTETEFDQFDAAKHAATPKIVIGSTVYTPTSVVVTVDAANAKKRKLLAAFTVPSTTAARYRIDMTSTEVTDVPFVQDVMMTAL